jgi:hypothetical protein
MRYLTRFKTIFRYFCLYILCFFTQNGYTQQTDKIYQTDSSVLSVAIMSTEGDTVWYHPNIAKKSKNVFGLLKTDVEKIVYQNGVIEYYGGKSIQYPPAGSKRTADVIYRKDNTEFAAHIVSIKGDSIYYQAEFNEVNKFKFSMPKSQVDKICYKNGLIVYISGQAAESTQLVAKQTERQRDSLRSRLDRKKNALKIAFTPDYKTFSYERRLGAWQSVEAKFGLINSSDKSIPAKGSYGAIGFKVILRGEDLLNNPRHRLHGWYLRPELVMGSYSHNYTIETFRSGSKTPEYQSGQHEVTFKCGVLNVGYQWVQGPLVIDLFSGFGFGSYTQSAGSFGIVRASRYAYQMAMPAISGDGAVKFKLGLYVGIVF